MVKFVSGTREHEGRENPVDRCLGFWGFCLLSHEVWLSGPPASIHDAPANTTHYLISIYNKTMGRF